MTTLVDDLVPDELWALVEPLLPPPCPPYGGRHRAISDRACFAAIVYMARTSTSWRLLPAQELGCGSPVTCWRRLAEWAGAGVFDQLHLEVLDRLVELGQLDWSRASVDSASVRARRGGTPWAQIPVDRAKPGSKLHLVCDGGGLPLTAAVTAANTGDTIVFQALLDDVPPIRTPAGRRRTRPGTVHADQADDSQPTARGCGGVGSPRGSPTVGSSPRSGWDAIAGGSSGRCPGELLQAAPGAMDRDSGRWLGFVLVACAVICCNRL
jgi:transposase